MALTQRRVFRSWPQSLNSDSDGSHAIEGAELFDVMEAFVPKSLMADE